MNTEEYDKVRAVDFFDLKKLIQILELSGYIGPIYHVGHIIRGCVVPFEIVYREACYYLNRLIKQAHFEIEQLTEWQFKKVLEDEGIVIVPSPEHLQKFKEKTQRMTRSDQKQLQDLARAMNISQSNVKYDDTQARWHIKGKKGNLTAEGNAWCLSLQPRSKRHLSSITRKLGFMQVSDTIAKLDRMPADDELPIIRKIAGLKKAPALSNERKNQLKDHAEAIRDRTPIRNSGVSAFFA